MGPAKIEYNSATFFTKEDISIDSEISRVQIRTSAYGVMSERSDSVLVRTSIVPDGQLVAAHVAAFWPHLVSLPGTDIHGGGSDVNAVFTGSDAAVHTIVAAGVHQMPNLVLSAVQSMIGSVELVGVRKNTQAWSVAAGMQIIAGSGTFEDALFTDALIRTQVYTADFTNDDAGPAAPYTGFDDFGTQDGFHVEFPMEISPISVDSEGILTYKLRSVGCIVRCIPVGPTPVNIQLAIEANAGQSRGATFGGSGSMIISGADTFRVTIPKCAMFKNSFRFGSSDNALREGEVAWVAQRTFAADGTPVAIATITP